MVEVQIIGVMDRSGLNGKVQIFFLREYIENNHQADLQIAYLQSRDFDDGLCPDGGQEINGTDGGKSILN